jgi:pseudolysin
MEINMKKRLSRVVLAGTLFASSFVAPVEAAVPVDLSLKQPAMLHALNVMPAEFSKISESVDANQTTHIRIQQTYSGYKVWGGDAVIHTRTPHANFNALLAAKNNSDKMNGIIYQGLAADLANTPSSIFKPAQAEQAFQHTAQSYAQNSGNKNPLTRPQKELLVYIDNNSIAHWAYLVSFVVMPAHATPVKPTYVVDAVTFKIYEKWNDMKTLDDVAAGGFGGNPKMGKLIYDPLDGHLPALSMERNGSDNMCYVENDDVIVLDRRYNDALVQFACPVENNDHNEYWDGEQDAINGGYSPANDALYAGKVIKAMYKKWFNLPVLLDEDGKPAQLVMRVHDDEENAYWDDGAMTFGDGYETFYPLVSLGVGAHEISHGFTDQHSHLNYTQQSGGLNESFSDMAAQAAEFYSSGASSWQIGAEILKASTGSLRYMDEPTKDCAGATPGFDCSISNINDYYSGIDVHYSSGVFNKLFYLLATSSDWDTRKAFAVMVQANLNYWTSHTSFTHAACGVLSAAKDLHYDQQPIKIAAKKVGIDTSRCV